MTAQNPDEVDQQELAAILDRWAAYVAERLDAGHSRTAVQISLVDQGFSPSDAAAFVEHVAKEYKTHVRRDGIRSLIIGGILISVGMGISAYSYSVAGPGGIYVVFWGLPIWGSWKVVSGIVKLTGG